MVLPYLKGSSLYILVLFMVNVLVSLEFKGLFKVLWLFSLISFKVYYKWYQSSFLGMKWENFWAKVGDFFFFFAYF
jgi:hypothetical protein